MSEQVLSQALSSLDSLVNNYISNQTQMRYNELAKQENLLSQLFQSEYNTQMQYENKLIEWGVDLPEEYQTTGYIDLVNESGDSDTLETLRNLSFEAKKNRKLLGSYIGAYNRGSRAAETMSSYADIDSSDTSAYPDLMFSSDEFTMLSDQGLFEEYGFDNVNNPAFKAGFFEGARNQDEAQAFQMKLKDERKLDLALGDEEFQLALKYGSHAADYTGRKVLDRVDASVGGIKYLTSLFNVEDSGDDLSEGLENLTSGLTLSNGHTLQKNGIVARLISSAITGTPNSPTLPTEGWLDLAKGAFKLDENMKKQIRNFALENKYNIPRVGSDEYSKFENLLLMDEKYGKDYKIMLAAKKDFQAIGMWTVDASGKANPLVYDSMKDLNAISNIYEREMDWVEEMMKTSDLGLEDYPINKTNPYAGGDINEDEFDLIFNQSFVDDDFSDPDFDNINLEDSEDYLTGEAGTNFFNRAMGVKGISLSEEMGKLNTYDQKEADALIEKAEKMIIDYDAGVADEISLHNSVSNAWKGLQQQTGLSFGSTIPRAYEFRELKKTYLESIGITKNMSSEEKAIVRQKIQFFNKFSEMYSKYINIAGAMGTGNRDADIEEMFLEEGFLSEEALTGPRTRKPRD